MADDRSPSNAIEDLAARGGVEFTHILAARERTAEQLSDRRKQLQEVAIDDDAAVVLLGSWGRAELTSGSDDDFIVLVDGEERDAANPTPDDVGAVLGTEGREPGSEGLFGQEDIVFSANLLGHIGLEHDTNRNLTHRVLLVLESVAVAGDAVCEKVRNEVLASYLAAGRKDHSPPRFFLNDLIRYWRTIAVDFEGKVRPAGEKWGLRNAKLRISRKLLFASGLLPLLDCHRFLADEMFAALQEELALPPTERVAAAFLRYGASDAGIRTLSAYDTWLARLDDDRFRATLAALRPDEAPDSEEFQIARRLGDEIQAGLLTLLFDTDRDLYARTREFAIF